MESLLTALSILIAIYAIVPRRTRIQLSLRIGLTLRIFLTSCIVALLLLYSHELLLSMGLARCTGFDYLAAHRDAITLWTFVFGTILVTIRWNTFRLSRRKLTRFATLSQELLNEQRHSEFLELLVQHQVRLVRFYDTEARIVVWRDKKTSRAHNPYISRRIMERFRSQLIAGTREILDGMREVLPEQPARHQGYRALRVLWAFVRETSKRAVRGFAYSLPLSKPRRHVASGVVKMAMLLPQFVNYVSSQRPYASISLLAWSVQEVFEFCDSFLRRLIEDPDSILYFELKNNQNLSSGHVYYLDPTNQIIHFLFSRIHLAEHLHVWKPIGDYVIDELDRLQRSSDDTYNQPETGFREEDRWKASLFVALRFFDVMLGCAIEQDVEWHMWLYYLPLFSDKISRNNRLTDPYVDQNAEFPTRYCYLAYEIISMQWDWILSVVHFRANKNVQLLSESSEHENGNIVKSAMISLNQCLSKFLLSGNFPKRFKCYVLDMAVGVYFDLRKTPNLGPYSRAFLNAFLDAGTLHKHDYEPYHRLVAGLLVGIDSIHYRMQDPEGWKTLEQSLAQAESRT